jgi:hypothetical protein
VAGEKAKARALETARPNREVASSKDGNAPKKGQKAEEIA